MQKTWGFYQTSSYFGGEIRQTHILFVDDIFVLLNGNLEDFRNIREILDCLCLSFDMKINIEKWSLLVFGLSDNERTKIGVLFSFSLSPIEEGLKYSGFRLKPNAYTIKD